MRARFKAAWMRTKQDLVSERDKDKKTIRIPGVSAFGGKADMTFCTKVDIASVLEDLTDSFHRRSFRYFFVPVFSCPRVSSDHR